jgi:uncharacterized protein
MRVTLLNKTEGIDVCVIQFAKLPELYRVKTRMQPQLNASQSLALHCDLTEHSFRVLSGSAGWDYQLWVTARSEAPDFFDTLTMGGSSEIHIQQGSDLGERMAYALQCVLESYRYVIIVGSDCPQLDQASLNQLINKLKRGDQAVLIPAYDGGYVALGLSEFSGSIFKRVEWGSDKVLDQTLVRLRALNWRYSLAEPLADIDRAEDLNGLDGFEWGKQWSSLAL